MLTSSKSVFDGGVCNFEGENSYVLATSIAIIFYI